MVTKHGLGPVTKMWATIETKWYRFVELFSGVDHLGVLVPRLVGSSDAELLHLLELVDAEDTPSILAMGASLLAEAGRVAGIPLGKVGIGHPLTAVVAIVEWYSRKMCKQEYRVFSKELAIR